MRRHYYRIFKGIPLPPILPGVYGQKIIWSVTSTMPHGFVLEYPRAVQCAVYL